MRCEYLSDTGSKGTNEDSFLVVDQLAVVSDGASPLIKSEILGDDRSGGQIASQTARQIFVENPELTLTELILKTNQAIAKSQPMEPFDAGRAWSTTIAAVRVGDQQLEYASVGDSPIVGIDRDDQLIQISKSYDWDAASLELWQSLVNEGVTNPRRHPRMEDQLLAVRRRANLDYGYCNGDPQLSNCIDSGTFPLHGLKAIILMTDGFMLPKQNPRSPENWKEFAGEFTAGGLKAVLKLVRDKESADKGCQKYPRFKTHDDATAIAIYL